MQFRRRECDLTKCHKIGRFAYTCTFVATSSAGRFWFRTMFLSFFRLNALRTKEFRNSLIIRRHFPIWNCSLSI